MSEDMREWKVKEAHRNICADYLRCIAKLIEQGAITSFDFAWSDEIMKPVGKMVTDAGFLTGSVESEFRVEVAKFNEEQASKIVVQDVTEQIKDAVQDHEPCTGEAKEQCRFCNDKLS